jgi:hypothetical protein
MQRIDPGEFVDVNGVPQWLTLRGAGRPRAAVLVVGGPGASFTALAPFFARARPPCSVTRRGVR